MSELAEVQRGLGRVEGELKSLTAALATYHVTNETRLSGLERRVNGIAKKQAWLGGLLAASGAFVGYITHRLS